LRSAGRRRSHRLLAERLAAELRAARPATHPGGDDRASALLGVLKQLPQRDREILTLTAWEGLRPKEIAAVLGTSANVVRVRLHRARSRLRRKLVRAGARRGSPLGDRDQPLDLDLDPV